VAARNRDVRGDPGTLAADGLLGDLDDYLLALAQDGFDSGERGLAIAAASATPWAFAALRSVELGGSVQVVPYVQERSLFEAHINEGGLHARKHAAYAPLHNHASDILVAFTLDEEFCEVILLDQRDAGFTLCNADDYFIGAG